MFRLTSSFTVVVVTALLGAFDASCAASSLELRNENIVAKFGPNGLTSIQQVTGKVEEVNGDRFSVQLDRDTVDASAAEVSFEQTASSEVVYTFRDRGYTVEVVYRIEPNWQFITKQIRVVASPRSQFSVREVKPLDLSFANAIDSVFIPGTYLPQFGSPSPAFPSPTKEFGAFVRFPNNSGIMMVVQNPFLQVERGQNAVTIHYSPEMGWNRSWGSFESDLACIGPFSLTGSRVPAKMVYEWKLGTDKIVNDGADRGEILAFTDCVRSFLLHPRQDPLSVEVGWTLNDYQIDVATPDGRTEYKRVLDTTSALGIQTLLYSPSNSELARIEQDADDWSWEHVLWLGFGQKLREGKWSPEKDEIPSSVSEMLAYAKMKHVGLLAYVYPSLPFSQDTNWLVRIPNKTTKNSSATLASREFQDFLLKELLAFLKRTGIAGYSFDYTFLNLPGSSSYAQWWGWCRVLRLLRKADPDIVIDGRQTYQEFGPWSWLAGNYPHPTGNDEQPESFVPFPDLHFDRVSADRVRFVNYWYRNYQFTPEEILPGYMTHQTERSINPPPNGAFDRDRREAKMVYTGFRQRDWDYLGYKYSVLSSIATGGWNNVMNMIPARDAQEYELFIKSSGKDWIRHWVEWTSQNKEYLQHTQTIIGPPAIGKVDGTSAIIGDRGYLFLFNPNYKELVANFQLDSSIGLAAQSERFVICELYPQKSRIIGKPGMGIWRYGDHFRLALDGTSATVLEIRPAPNAWRQPVVVDNAGNNAGVESKAVLENGVIQLENVSGEPGTTQEVGVLLPDKAAVRSMTINGRPVPFSQNDVYVCSTVRFAGMRFAHSQQVQLTGGRDGSFTGSFVVPQRVLNHMKTIANAWPVRWNPDDYNTTWLVPSRLLLFIQFAEPNDSMEVSLALDGKPLALDRAYSSVRSHAPSFVGFYADLSRIRPDTRHDITLQLPVTATRQFQGIFFDNVEPELTEELFP